MSRWIKCNDSLFIDTTIVKFLTINHVNMADNDGKKLIEVFQVTAYAESGSPLPALFTHESYEECEAWVNAHFLEVKN